MKKNIILLLTALLAFMIASCTNPNLPGGMSGTDDTGTVQFSWSEPGQANNSRSSFSRNVVATGNNIQDAKKVVISIEAADGTVVYSQKQLNLFNFNGSFLSEPLSLKVGSYKLTEYLLLDAAGTVIYATPKAGSAKAHLVANPLPINFTVTKDAATNVKPEVVDAAEVTPDQFGYIGFDFVEVKKFDFLVTVMIYDAGVGSFVMTNAAMDVTTDSKTYNFALGNATSRVTVNDLSSDYTLTVKTKGYEDYRVTYTNAEMKAFFQTPLLIMPTKLPDGVILFADSDLEAAVRTAINKPTGYIFAADVATLTKLGVYYKEITDLSGIEHLTALTNLTIAQNNSLIDISLLSGLTNLQNLTISGNKVTDLTPLSTLVNLRYLDLARNNISSLNPILGLKKLEFLKLTQNKVADISGLPTLPKLICLHIGHNSVADFSPLSSMTQLGELYLQNYGISDISFLAPLTKLHTLSLLDNNISNTSVLSNMPNLMVLGLGRNNISDIAPLVNNPGLGNRDMVSLGGNPLSSHAQNVQIPALRARGVNVSLN